MQKVLFLIILALAIPMTAFADGGVDFTNAGGTLTGTTSGLSLTGSTLIAVSGLNGGGLITGNNLGSFGFSTGALLTGTLKDGGTFAGGGSFTVTGNGTNGVPSGVLFQGTFSGPVSWTLVTLGNGTHNYTLTGVLAGTLGSGSTTNGVTIQLTINTGTGYFTGSAKISSGDTNVVVPEPSSLTLIGGGMLVLAGVLRRRLTLGRLNLG